MRLNWLLLLLLFSISSHTFFSQSLKKIDSLNTIFNNKSTIDSVKLDVGLNLIRILYRKDPNQAILIAEKTITISKHLNKPIKLAQVFIGLGLIYKNQNDLDSAEYFQKLALNLFQKNNAESEQIADVLNNLGVIEKNRTNYDKALGYYLRAMDLYKSQASLSKVYTNIGNVYKNLNNNAKAKEYYQLDIEICEKAKDFKSLANAYDNLSGIYILEKDYEKAKNLLSECLQILSKDGTNLHALSGVYSAFASIYMKEKNFVMAKEYLIKSLKYSKESKSIENYVTGLLFLSELNRLTSKPNSSIEQLKEVESIFKTQPIEKLNINYYQESYEVYSALNNFKLANFYLNKINHDQDSIFKNDIASKISQMEKKIQNEKKQKEIELLKKNELIKNSELKRQKYVNYFIIGIALLIASILIFVARSLNEKKKSNKILEQKNIEIEEQKNLLQVTNKEITDSINYAQRIQESLLTSKSIFKENLKEFFILYKPKDIVSGDFYWATKTNSGFMIICGDCTGHGVPGAFMSLLGISYLNEIVNQANINKPNLIFDSLKEKIISNLNQKDEARKDGMDASLVCIKDNLIEFACANNQLWQISDNKLIKHNADKHPIGMGINDDFCFTNHSITKNKGDMFFMFTDGYADQFGGPKGKKFKYTQLEQILLSNCNRPLIEQKNILEKTIDDWKGNLEQLDDILLIGFKI